VRLDQITKRFGRVVANDEASFEARAGEVHALVGENGAGKSTLMRILYGLTAPDRGRVEALGRRGPFRNPGAAIAAGVGMVHQHFMLVPPLTVAENVFLGREPARVGCVRRREAAAEVARLASEHRLDVDPLARVQDLGVGAQQRVEILKVLYRGARVLILDEPTAVLTPQETSHLFQVLDAMRGCGATVILITHRLEEVRRIADRVTVMRAGRTIATHEAAGVRVETLAAEMIGREMPRAPSRPSAPAGGEMLELASIVAVDDRGVEALHGVSLAVRGGEIVGVAGVEGNGQRELVEVAAGLRRPRAGEVRVAGEAVTGLGRREFLARGVAFVPEDRLDRGLVRGFSLAENLVLGRHRGAPVARRVGLDRASVRAAAEEMIGALDIRPAAPDLAIDAFSGGNQQKAVLARELHDRPRLLVAAQPTRGVDVGAVAQIHHEIVSACRAGAAVLMVSAELGELLRLANRIVVLYRGRIVHETPADAATSETLGRWMLGGET
jgi:simple sugar transport system ATP-binding protein